MKKTAGLLLALCAVAWLGENAWAGKDMRSRAERCFDAGTVFGHQYEGLDARMRGLGGVLANFCSTKKDPTLNRIPNESDVDNVLMVIQGQHETMQDGAHIKTDPLKRTMRDGRGQESQLLDELLK